MRYRVRDFPALLRTPLGRSQFLSGLSYRAWPLLSCLASAYRLRFVRHTRVVAVVGSFGKTTTTRAVAAALGRPPDPRLEFNEFSFLVANLLRVRPGDRHAVLEVGIGGPGQMAAYARLVRPDIAVVTSIGSEHNRSLGTLEVTRAEKAEMIRVLPESGLAVLNGDDPNVNWMRCRTRATVRRFGFQPGNDVRASEVALDWPRGTRFRLHAAGETRTLRVRLLGRHQLYSILAAVTVALAEGFSLDRVIPALEALPPTPGRLELVPLPNGAFVLRDDFKSPLETVEAALDLLAEIPARRRIVVLGDVSETPGSQGPIYRRLGERIAPIATRAIIVGGGFQPYAAGATRAGLARGALVNAGRSVLRAIEAVQEDLQPGDVVLVKGRYSQRLDRVALALAGRPVLCAVPACDAMPTRCHRCPMLERGWDGLRVMI